MKERILPLWLNLCVSMMASDSFFMPDEADDALHRLKNLITSAKERVTIITPAADRDFWDKSIAASAARGIAITLVTTGGTLDAGASLVRFAGVDYRNVAGQQSAYRSGTLAMTLVIADGSEACFGTLPLLPLHFEHDLGFLECRRDADTVGYYNAYAKRVVARSKPYLQP